MKHKKPFSCKRIKKKHEDEIWFSYSEIFRMRLYEKMRKLMRMRLRISAICGVWMITNHSRAALLITFSQKFDCKTEQTSKFRKWCHFLADFGETKYNRCCVQTFGGFLLQQQKKQKPQKQITKHSCAFLTFYLWIACKEYNNNVQSYALICWLILLSHLATVFCISLSLVCVIKPYIKSV